MFTLNVNVFTNSVDLFKNRHVKEFLKYCLRSFRRLHPVRRHGTDSHQDGQTNERTDGQTLTRKGVFAWEANRQNNSYRITVTTDQTMK